MRQKLLIIAAVFFGILAFMFTYQQINLERNKLMESAKDVDVILVTQDLTRGQKITVDDIRKFTVKRFAGTINSREIPWTQKDNILDRPVIDHIKKNAILTWSDFNQSLSSGRTGLTRFTRPGFRAVSIPVDTVSSVTGLVQPNNYVDLIGTFRFPDAKGDAALDTITLTILQKVKVLACGTDMGQMRPGQAQATRGYSTVTLELTPKEVEMIVFASQKGRLTMSLRSYEDTDSTGELQSVDWSFLQKNILKYQQERDLKMRKILR